MASSRLELIRLALQQRAADDRVSAASTSEEAVALATKDEPLDVEWAYGCDGGRAWYRIDPDAPTDSHGNEYWFNCQPTDPGAVEFWVLVVEEAAELQGKGS